MFGPTPSCAIRESVDFSHREPRFFDLLDSTAFLFQNKFDLHDFDILFLTGSGTLSIEALIYSCMAPVEIEGPEGKFTQRWKCLADHYNKLKPSMPPVSLSCGFETSICRSFTGSRDLLDAVSSFPYYPIPKAVFGFGTVSSKQLGAAPVLAIIGVRKECWHRFGSSDVPSYLNLKLYRDYLEASQTPFTPAYALLSDLKVKLEHFDLDDLRQRIRTVSTMIVDHFGEENIIGDKIGPALTIKAGSISQNVAKKWNLYGYWQQKQDLQIFTYSENPSFYAEFLRDVPQKKSRSNTSQNVVSAAKSVLSRESDLLGS